MAICERCTIIESAFGLKDPLPPRVASLDAETTIPYPKADHEESLRANDNRQESLLAEDSHEDSLQAKDETGLALLVKDEFNRVPRKLPDATFDPLWLSDGVKTVWQPPASTLSGIRDSPLAPHR